MAEITAEIVNKLRQKTNAGMMDCKKALTEAKGDLEAAETILRKKGITKAEGKADRVAKEGVIHAKIDAAKKVGVLAEVNCETDFVAKNDNFKGFVEELCSKLVANPGATADDPAMAEFVKSKIAEIQENIVLRRFVRFEAGAGEPVFFQSYIHLAGRVGVLLEVGAQSEALGAKEAFQTLTKDICLHIAAANPSYLSREEVPAALIAKEREIAAEQMKGKPANVIDKIVDGKMGKFYADFCLLEQAFIKNPDITITGLVKSKIAELGGNIVVRRFTRFAVGGE